MQTYYRDSPIERRRSDKTAQMARAMPFVLLLATVAAVYTFSQQATVEGEVLWASIATSGYLSLLLTILFSGHRFYGIASMRIGPLFVGYAIFAFGASTVTILERQVGSGIAVDRSMVPRALIYICIAFTFWAVGYVLGKAPLFNWPFRGGFNILTKGVGVDVRSKAALLLVFAVSLGSDLALIFLTGRYGYLGDSIVLTAESASWYIQPLTVISDLKYVAIFGLSYRVFVSRQDKLMTALLPSLIVAFSASVFTGMKEAFVVTTAAALIPYLISPSRLKLLTVALLLGIFVAVVTPLVALLRYDVRGSGSLDIGAALSAAVERIFIGGLSGPGVATVSDVSTFERIRIVDNLALIVSKTPEVIPYKPLTELISAPLTGLVPRLVWPDKPVRVSGYEFHRTFYGGGGESSSALTLQGSLYLYGGLIILVIGMFVVGLFIRGLDDSFSALKDPRGLLLFSMICILVVKQEMDAATFLSALGVLGIKFFLALRLTFRLSGGQDGALGERRELGECVRVAR